MNTNKYLFWKNICLHVNSKKFSPIIFSERILSLPYNIDNVALFQRVITLPYTEKMCKTHKSARSAYTWGGLLEGLHGGTEAYLSSDSARQSLGSSCHKFCTGCHSGSLGARFPAVQSTCFCRTSMCWHTVSLSALIQEKRRQHMH